MMNNTNPYQIYQQNQVKTASQGAIILLLYDGAIRFTQQAIVEIEQKKWEKCCNFFIRAQDIVEELDRALDRSAGEVAENLHHTYRSIRYLLVQANIKRDSVLAGRVCKMLEKLRTAWAVVFGKSPGQEEGGRSIGA